MHALITLLSSALLLSTTLAVPTPAGSPLPVVLWHGLGDKYDNEGLLSVVSLLNATHPNIKVHIVRFGDDGSADQKATFFGNVTAQIAETCNTLSLDRSFASNGGQRIDALGSSQGGAFLRGLVQTCPFISVRSLVTFGSPHNGIADIPPCGKWDLICKGAQGIVRSNRWGAWAQSSVVPAQYFREVDWDTGLGSEEYLENSGWLADINNERKLKNVLYPERLGRLDKFAMYLFDEDTTVVPKESAWFADKNLDTGKVVPLKDRKLYEEDWLGLKGMDEKKMLEFRTVKHAGHMQLDDKVLVEAFNDFFGPERSFANSAWLYDYAGRLWQTAMRARQNLW